MTEDATTRPLESAPHRPLSASDSISATGEGATAIKAGAGANVTVNNQVGISADGSQIGELTIGSLMIAGQLVQQITPLPTSLAALHQLRAPVADFVGRETEIAELARALGGSDTAAVAGVSALSAITGVGCLIGMGGIGKTELAMVVAQRLRAYYPDAQIVLSLQGTRDTLLSAADALRRVIGAFYPDASLPEGLDELGGLYRSLLDGRRVLILADDAADAAQVRPLLPPPGSALLITSRHQFTLPGMRRIDLRRLPENKAIMLSQAICERLDEVQAQQLTIACGRLPLALRVAASALAADISMDIGRYLSRLADQRRGLAVLQVSGDFDLDVEASLALSYNLLSAEAQRDLLVLGVFAAKFDLAAGAAVLDVEPPEGVEPRLGELFRRSLLEYETTERRYELHDLVRAFALTRLNEGEHEARLRHARHYISVAEFAQYLYRTGSEQIRQGLGLFDQERINLDAARSWLRSNNDDEACARLVIEDADATVGIGDLRYDKRSEQVPQLELALTVARRLGQHDAEERFLGNLGIAYYFLSDYARALEYYYQQLSVARELGNRQGECNALANLGLAYASLSDYPRAIDHYQQSLAITCELGDHHGEGATLGNLGNVYDALGDYSKAIEHHQLSLAIARELGDRHGEATALGNLGNAYFSLGDYPKAIDHYEQVLTIADAIGDRRGEGTSFGNLGLIYEGLGDYPRAINHHQQHLAIAREIGDRHGEASALGGLGSAYEGLGDYPRAINHHQQYLAIAREIGDRHGEASALGGLGSTYASLGDYLKAIEHYKQSLAIAREIGDRRGESAALGNLGSAYASLGDYLKAIEHHKQSLAIAREIGDRHGEGTTLGNLGNAYTSLGDYPKAIEHYQQRITIAGIIGDRQGEANAKWTIGLVLKKRGDLGDALAALEAGLAFYQQLGHPLVERMVRQVVDVRHALQRQSKGWGWWRRLFGR